MAKPAAEELTIRSIGQILEITVTDIRGRRVLQEASVNRTQFVLPVRALESGVYLVEVHTHDGRYRKKLRVQP